MKALKEWILKEGVVLSNDILKVDSFLNQQLDVPLLVQIGEEFADHFANKKVTKILTIETAGIPIALVTAMALKVPMIFARKQKSVLTTDEAYSAQVFSYTKRVMNRISIAKKFLTAADRVLIIDDFLAQGGSASGLISITQQAGAHLVGIGVVIEKSFQEGSKKLRDLGYHIHSLARVKKLIPPNHIEFAEE